ncbi:hypothetical protein BC629DRAFT_1550866 [Irpex lacteus]|nr:hypothetical protein BC629DRAFT_1550866 [Irpex lacteus]
MASDTDRLAMRVVQAWTYTYFILATLVIHEHLITLYREVRCIWRQQRSKGLVLFVVNRYALLSLAVTLILKNSFPGVAVRTVTSCTAATHVSCVGLAM